MSGGKDQKNIFVSRSLSHSVNVAFDVVRVRNRNETIDIWPDYFHE